MRPLLRPPRLSEHVEHAGEHVGRDANARVLYRHRHLIAVPFHCHLDLPAPFGVLAAVIEQVGKDLGQAGRVRVHIDRGWRERDRQSVTRTVDEWAARLHRTVEDGR